MPLPKQQAPDGNHMNLKKGIIVCLMSQFFILLLSAWSLTALAQRPELERAMAEGDHGVMAQYYRVEAQSMKEAAAEHERMERLYLNQPASDPAVAKSMSSHCKELRLLADQAAFQYDALAQQEEQLAKQKK